MRERMERVIEALRHAPEAERTEALAHLDVIRAHCEGMERELYPQHTIDPSQLPIAFGWAGPSHPED